MPIDSALIESLLAPVAGEHPSGKDLRYDPRYDQVKEARREDLELPPGGLATERKLADWPAVITLARGLLESETKDLQLAAWLAEALLKRDGLAGLATGLDALRGILERFWDDCYPAWDEEDPELRAGPLDWVGTRLDVAVRQSAIAPGGITLLDHQLSRGVPTEAEAEANRDKRAAREEALGDGRRAPEEVDQAIAAAPKAFYKALVADVDAALASAAGLERVSDERFGRDAPSFGKLRAALEETRRLAGTILAEKLIADPDPVVEEPAGGVGAYEPPAGWAAEGGMPAEPVSAADAAARVGAAAKYLRAQNAASPAPYLILRGLRWGELRAAGGEIDPKLLDAPAPAIRVRLKGLLLDGKWAELLEQSEAVMATGAGRGWLDLQRYVLTACDRLGGGYDAVAAGIRAELRALVGALPTLPTMTLMDDTPAANPETQAWLAAEQAAAGEDERAADASTDALAEDGAADHTQALDAALAEEDATSEHGGLGAGTRRRSNHGGAGHAAAGGTPPRDPFVLARAELAQGRPNKAIEILMGEVARERSPRGRFVRQTQIAYVMVEAGLDAVARPILEKLVSTIDERSLEDWEAGPLVAQPMALLCRVIDRMDGEGSDTRNELYLRICRLDPLQAIALPRAGG
jgi:type VI secretion system protein ImpA